MAKGNVRNKTQVMASPETDEITMNRGGDSAELQSFDRWLSDRFPAARMAWIRWSSLKLQIGTNLDRNGGRKWENRPGRACGSGWIRPAFIKQRIRDAGGFAGVNPPMPKLAQAAVPRSRLAFIPSFSGGGSSSWDSNCYIMGKRGILHLSQRFGEKRNYRDSAGSCSRFLGDWFIPVFCSYHLAEMIHAGAEIVAWPAWCFYLLNKDRMFIDDGPSSRNITCVNLVPGFMQTGPDHWDAAVQLEDLICLPPIAAHNLGNLGPFVICTKVTNSIALLDPFTLRHCYLDADQYWRSPFKALHTSRQLVEYIVLDVKVASTEVKFAAQSYDLHEANQNDIELENYKSLVPPDTIKIKKSYKEKNQRKHRKPNPPKLKPLEMESYHDKDYTSSEMASVTDKEDVPSVPLDYLLADLDSSDKEEGDDSMIE
ncbi:60S ribosomal export protein NMD3 [Citrus sinensis]|nr:60S ribosomal export protein NMD3 [Citrus sinensis]